MGKAKLGLLLAGAYALGAAVLLVIALSLPRGTLCSGLHRVPELSQRAAQLARMAVHAGSLGLKHLPAALEPQGLSPRHRALRFCTREPSASCGSSTPPQGLLAPLAPRVLRVLVLKEG